MNFGGDTASRINGARQVTVHDSQVHGAQVTTLANTAGFPVTRIQTNADGTFPLFTETTGNYAELWVDSHDGSGRVKIYADPASVLAAVQTLSNKRITKRVLALANNSATPAINTDLYDVVHITAQTLAITSMTSGLTGTPVDGDTLRISITGTASVAITWGASFEASTVALPTTTSSTARLDVSFVLNTETGCWRCVQKA